MKHTLMLGIVMLLVVGCNGGLSTSISKTTPRSAVGTDHESDTTVGCLTPPDFQESDLVGTWINWPGTVKETLILKDDGTYKQIYDNPTTGDRFESDWQTWWVEYRENSVPRLHLQGMRKCDRDRKDCLRKEGGAYGRWIDFCDGQATSMSREVILLIIGVPSSDAYPALRDLELSHLRAEPDATVGHFRLQEGAILP